MMPAPSTSVMKASAPVLAFLLAACSPYVWTQTDKIDRIQLSKVETVEAPRICEAVTGLVAKGCAIRLRANGAWRCVTIVAPADMDTGPHETGHCFYDHN